MTDWDGFGVEDQMVSGMGYRLRFMFWFDVSILDDRLCELPQKSNTMQTYLWGPLKSRAAAGSLPRSFTCLNSSWWIHCDLPFQPIMQTPCMIWTDLHQGSVPQKKDVEPYFQDDIYIYRLYIYIDYIYIYRLYIYIYRWCVPASLRGLQPLASWGNAIFVRPWRQLPLLSKPGTAPSARALCQTCVLHGYPLVI